MPITLNPVTGELDATVVDDNFGELETFLKENITDDDFNGKFNKYNIRRYTGGKISGFNSGSKPYNSARSTASTGTFENNWVAGTKASIYIKHDDKSINHVLASEAGKITDGLLEKTDMDYSHPLSYPFELLGYPGGSLYYDFQEQGFADPVTFYQENHGLTVTNWPPASSPLSRFPSDECWSRWLTIPDAAGGVYVDEPCVALITAQVQGNYFFTPALKVHGTNTSASGANTTVTVVDEDDISVYSLSTHWKNHNPSFAEHAGIITEGMQHSAYLRLALFVDTNPIIWDDEFFNGDAHGNPVTGLSGHGYNPWIGESPDGAYAAVKPEGVAKSRSWIKVTDLTYRVRQRGSYKVIGAVELKGRRRYNFSMKFKPAMTFGHVAEQEGAYVFKNSYFETSPTSRMPDADTTHKHNPGWYWGANSDQSWEESYFFPGGDALVTNLIESSSISVEFFYGQSLSSVLELASELKQGVVL